MSDVASRLRSLLNEVDAEDCGDPGCGDCEWTRLCNEAANEIEHLCAAGDALHDAVMNHDVALWDERLSEWRNVRRPDLLTRLHNCACAQAECDHFLAAAEIKRLRDLSGALADALRSGSDNGWDILIEAWEASGDRGNGSPMSASSVAQEGHCG